MELLLLCALAADPRAVITGPSGGVSGDKIVLNSRDSENATQYRWQVESDRPEGAVYEVDATGEECRVLSYPGTYWVMLIVGDGMHIAETVRHKLVIQPSPSPGPLPPGPTPGPKPIPPVPVPVPPVPVPIVLPDGEFLISKDVLAWANEVQGPTRAKEAAAMAGAAESVAAAISAGALKGPQEILSAMLAANNAALGDRSSAWDAFGSKFSDRLQKLYTAGRLKTPANWAQMLREVAAGLNAAAIPASSKGGA